MSRFVPSATVTGRSVVVRSVRHGWACGLAAARVQHPVEPRPRARMHGPHQRHMRGDAAQRGDQ